MTGLRGKRWYFFIWDEGNIEHLAAHRIEPNEAEEVFFNRYIVTPNKRRHGAKKFLIEGRADSGRPLRLVFEDLGQNTARIITGWDL